jgi:hypothetical protein
MANPEIIEYAREQLKAGHSVDEIRDSLIKTGWSKEEVEEAISAVQTQAPANPTTTPTQPGLKPGKLLYGLVLSITAGLLIILNTIRILAPSLEEQIIINVIQFLPLSTEHTILTLVSGILMIIGAFLAYKTWGGIKGKIGGILVIVFSLIYFISAGYIIFFIIGIIGGLLALMKK